jgi:hypothetical protein
VLQNGIGYGQAAYARIKNAYGLVEMSVCHKANFSRN